MENIIVLNEELICDIFPDGEAVIYDDKNENTHMMVFLQSIIREKNI